MPSTLRNDNRRAMTLARISVAWDKAPDLRLGELLLLSLSPAQVANFSHLQDSHLADAVDRLVLLRNPEEIGLSGTSSDRRADVLAEVAKAWDEAPDLRLGQLLLLALSPEQVARFTLIEDQDVVAAVAKFVRTRDAE